MKIKLNELNRRFISFDPLSVEEIRAENESDKLKIKGTPIVYNREAVLYDSDNFRWTETIEAGAARDALLRAEQVLLWNHDAAKPMAARKNNTLSAREDSVGVHIDADVSGTAWGREGFEAIRAGLVDKMSFGFYVKPDGYTEERSVENGKRILKRTIKKFDRITDFSPVTYPAYQDTDISARDAQGVIAEIEAEEKQAAEKRNEITAKIAKTIASGEALFARTIK